LFSDSLEPRDFGDANFFDAEVAFNIHLCPALGGQEALNNGVMLPISHQQAQVLLNVEFLCLHTKNLQRTSFVINPTAIHRKAWSPTMTTGWW
jgi:hypothetical protein